jgi:hypothetical protein
MRQREIERIEKNDAAWICHYGGRRAILESTRLEDENGKLSCIFNLPKDGKCYFDNRKCDAVKFQLKEVKDGAEV